MWEASLDKYVDTIEYVTQVSHQPIYIERDIDIDLDKDI